MNSSIHTWTRRIRNAFAGAPMGFAVLVIACVVGGKGEDAGGNESTGCKDSGETGSPLSPTPDNLPEVEVQVAACLDLEPESISNNEDACIRYGNAVNCCYEPDPWVDNSGESGASTGCLTTLLPAPDGCPQNFAVLECATALAEESCESFNVWRKFVTHEHVGVRALFAWGCQVPDDLPCREETVAAMLACDYGHF